MIEMEGFDPMQRSGRLQRDRIWPFAVLCVLAPLGLAAVDALVAAASRAHRGWTGDWAVVPKIASGFAGVVVLSPILMVWVFAAYWIVVGPGAVGALLFERADAATTGASGRLRGYAAAFCWVIAGGLYAVEFLLLRALGVLP